MRKAAAITALAVITLSVSEARAATTTDLVSPLTKFEIRSGVEAGLGCDFRVGTHAYFVIVIGEALLKIGTGLHHMKLRYDRSLAVINNGGSIDDGHVRILIERDAVPTSRGLETSVRPARMVLRHAGKEQTLTGRWTCGA